MLGMSSFGQSLENAYYVQGTVMVSEMTEVKKAVSCLLDDLDLGEDT